MNSITKLFSSSYKEYEREAEKYILTLKEPVAKTIRFIEESMRIFLEIVYGYLPTAGEIKWPVLEPNYNTNVERLVPFHEAYSYGITDATVHFHYWKNGRPVGKPIPIFENPAYEHLLKETIGYL